VPQSRMDAVENRTRALQNVSLVIPTELHRLPNHTHRQLYVYIYVCACVCVGGEQGVPHTHTHTVRYVIIRKFPDSVSITSGGMPSLRFLSQGVTQPASYRICAYAPRKVKLSIRLTN
jgi:hypothetical protein